MEELETPHPDYLKGFNEGYIIAQHMPDVAKQVGAALSNSDRSMGFKDGQNEYVHEIEQERYPTFLRSDWEKGLGYDSSPDKQKEQDRSKDKDDYEFDQ